MHAGDGDLERARHLDKFIHPRGRQAELGSLAAGVDLLVMAVAVPQVDAQPHIAATEHLGPVAQRLDVVHGHRHAQREGRFVFGLGRKARREQHAPWRQLRQRLEYAAQFAVRDAFQPEAGLLQRHQDGRMRIGLDRVIALIHRGYLRQRMRTLTHRGQVVCVTRRPGPGQRQQMRALGMPPRRGSGTYRADDLPPARPEHLALADRHRTAVDQFRVQDRQQTVGIGFVDDEGQVQVVGRLRNHVHAFLPERGPHVGELVQQRTHAASDQGDGRARNDDLDLADLRKIGRQRRQHIGVDQVFRRIQRHGDVGLGRTDQVHRQAVLLEQREHVGQEADLLPHADAFHRHQHDAIAAADRLDAQHQLGIAVDAGTRQIRALGVQNRHRHAGIAARLDRARMQHLGAGGGDFLRFVIVQPGQQPRIRHFFRVGAEHARHVGPDFHPAGAEQRAEVRRRGIRTATAQNRGAAIGMTRNEALRDQQACRLRGETRAPIGIGLPLARDRQPLGPFALIGLRRQCGQPLARIQPPHVQAAGMQIRRADGGRQ